MHIRDSWQAKKNPKKCNDMYHVNHLVQKWRGKPTKVAKSTSQIINQASPIIYRMSNITVKINHFFSYPKFPNCLCIISTRHLELLLWGAGLTAQHLQDHLIFFIQLNYVYKFKENKIRCCNLMLNSPCYMVSHWGFHFLLFIQAM